MQPRGVASRGIRRIRHLPRPAAQHRGRAGAARRHPGQQRGLPPGQRVPAPGALLRAGARPDLRRLRAAIGTRPAGRPGDAEAAVRGGRGAAGAGRRPLSRPARARRRDHHQRRRVRADRPRSRPQARPDQGGRGRRQPRLRPGAARERPRADRDRRARAVRPGPGRRITRRVPHLPAGADRGDQAHRERLAQGRQGLRRADPADRPRPEAGRAAALGSGDPGRPPQHGQDGDGGDDRRQRRRRCQNISAESAHGHATATTSSACSRSRCRPSSWRPGCCRARGGSSLDRLRRGDIAEEDWPARGAGEPGAGRACRCSSTTRRRCRSRR